MGISHVPAFCKGTEPTHPGNATSGGNNFQNQPGSAPPHSDGSADISYVTVALHILVYTYFLRFYVLLIHISIFNCISCSKQLEVSFAVHWPCRSDWDFGRFRLRSLPLLAVHESLLCCVAF